MPTNTWNLELMIEISEKVRQKVGMAGAPPADEQPDGDPLVLED